MTIPKFEEVLDHERDAMEEFSDKYERKCYECERCDVPEEVEMSYSFPPDLSDKIGFCHKFFRFITNEDTNFSEDCDSWC